MYVGDRTAVLVGKRFALRHRVIPTRSLYLNCAGDERFDDVTIEFNGVAGDELSLDELIAGLPRSWDELWLPALRTSAFGGLAETRGRGYRVRIDREVPAYFVDLDQVRERGFLPLVSGQTRSQIRRAQRAVGALEVEVASDPREAIAIYEELTDLHGTSWRAKGQPGAFADPWIDRFHRRLIERRFEAGEIQMVRIRADGSTLGCLYNFVWQDRVLQYQTGFRMFDDARKKPGFVCHVAAIEHNAKDGRTIYDWLAGAMRYKQSLSTGSTKLVWGRIQRTRPWFALEDRALAFVRARRQRAETGVASDPKST